jgi:hypothetical protein
VRVRVNGEEEKGEKGREGEKRRGGERVPLQPPSAAAAASDRPFSTPISTPDKNLYATAQAAIVASSTASPNT